MNQSRLKQLIHYDPDSGCFTWLVKRGRSAIRDDDLTFLKNGYCASIWPVSDAEDGDIPVYLEQPAAVMQPVKFTDCDFAAVSHMSGGSKDYCNGFVDGTQNAMKLILAAGGTVEG